MLKDSPVTSQDVDIALKIWGPSVALLVACCKSNNGTTKARQYRFWKRSMKMKVTYYLELKKSQ